MSTTSKIKQEFFDSLKRGTGEAYFILKNNPTIDFSPLIIKGAVTNYAFDRQSEDSRAFYIYGLIKKSKQKDNIITSVLIELQKQREDFYNLDQMCDLAVMFYKNGRKDAAEALRKRFEKNSNKNYQFCGQAQLIEIDGIHGLLKVAETIGQILYNNQDDSESSFRVDQFQKKNKSIDVYKELTKAGKKNKYVKIYLNSILADKTSLSKIKGKRTERFSYEFIKEQMAKKPFYHRFLSTERNSELTKTEVLKLANEFLIEVDKKRQELYLRFFSTRKFPYNLAPILKIAKSKNPKNTRLVDFAVETLKNFSSKEIRELALDKLNNYKDPGNFLKLLVSNYIKGDFIILKKLALRSSNYSYIHNLVYGFVAIYEANPTEECKEPLEIIYSKMNCGLHRKDIVKILIENEVISEMLLKELQYDSYSEVRKLYRQQKKLHITAATR